MLKNVLQKSFKAHVKIYGCLDLQIDPEPLCNQLLFLDVYASRQYHSTYHLSLLTWSNPSTIAT